MSSSLNTLHTQPVIVPFQNSLLVHVVTNDSLVTLLHQLTAVPLLGSLKLDIELTLHTCKVIETMIAVGSTKVDKKTIVMAALHTIFPDLGELESALLSKQIDFLFSNKLIVAYETTALTYSERLVCVFKSCVGKSKNT